MKDRVDAKDSCGAKVVVRRPLPRIVSVVGLLTDGEALDKKCEVDDRDRAGLNGASDAARIVLVEPIDRYREDMLEEV